MNKKIWLSLYMEGQEIKEVNKVEAIDCSLDLR